MKKKLSVLLSILMLLTVLLTIQFASATAPGRPIITPGETIRTADGDLIRSGVTWYSKLNVKGTTSSLDPNYWVRAKKAGLNTIRITNWDLREYTNGTFDNPGPYADVWSIEENIERIDTMLGYANSEGLYMIITPSMPGAYNKEYLLAFWGQVADRYKNNTNVIYEVTNEPVSWEPSDYTHANLNDLADIYQVMRAAAPNTPILNLSFSNTNDSMLAKVQSYTTKAGIVWEDDLDVVSFHPYGTSPFTNITQLQNNDYPVMNTEFNYTEFHAGLPTFGGTYQGQKFEQEGISWMNFRAGRSDGRFTEHYDFVNDAKAKGYYWEAGTLVTDSLDDWTKVADTSTNLQFALGNPSYFGGDTSRATRSDTSQGYIVYEAEGLGQFDARIYSNNNFAGIKFYVSHNGDEWQDLAVTRTNTTGPVSNWKGGNFKSTNGLPAGTKFLKIEMNATNNSYGIQISSVQFTTWSEEYSHIEDKMDVWSVVNDHYNVKFGTENNSNFGGDGSRLRIDNTAENGYAIYELDDMGGFYARVYFKASEVTYPVDSSMLAFLTSTNGITWTAASVGTTVNEDPVATANGWKLSLIENLTSLPVGTQYVKLEFKTQYVQVGELDVYSNY